MMNDTMTGIAAITLVIAVFGCIAMVLYGFEQAKRLQQITRRQLKLRHYAMHDTVIWGVLQRRPF